VDGEGLLVSVAEEAGCVGETRRPLSEADPAEGLLVVVVAVTVTSLWAGSLRLPPPVFLVGSSRAGIDGKDGREPNDKPEKEDIELLDPKKSKRKSR